jgi:hypothetical protein
MSALYGLREAHNMSRSAKVSKECYLTARPVLKMKEAQLLMRHETGISLNLIDQSTDFNCDHPNRNFIV